MLEIPIVETTKVKNAHWWRRILNNICQDERITPNRRLLAALVGMQMDATTVFDKKLYTALLLGEFVNRAGIKLYDQEDKGLSYDPRTQLEKKADQDIKDVFQAVLNVNLNERGSEDDNVTSR